MLRGLRIVNKLWITLPLWPPTTNTIYRNVRGRTLMAARARQFYSDGSKLIRSRGVMLTGRLGVRISLHPPNKRRFDVDNRIKAILDLMTKSGIWEDDSQVDHLVVTRKDIEPKTGKIVIEIWPLHEKPSEIG